MLARAGQEFGGGTRGASWATREMLSPESSAVAELPPVLAEAALDMVEARDTRWPESFITMAVQSV